MSSETTSAKSPRRTPKAKQTPAQEAISPTRVSRKQEQEQLRDLNKRLEFYILKNREKDAQQGVLERELDLLRQTFEEEKKASDDLFKQQLQDARNRLDEERAKAGARDAELNRLRDDLEQVRSELEQQNENVDTLTEENDQLKRTNGDLTVEANRAKEDLKQLMSQLEVEKKKTQRAINALEEERKRTADDNERCAVAESALKAREADLALLQKNFDDTVSRLRAKNAELTSKNAHVEERLREVFARELAKILEERQQQFQEEKQEGMEELKRIYDEKITAYRDHLERAGHELESLKSRMSQLEKDEESIRKEREEMQTLRTEVTRQRKEFEAVLAKERNRPNDQLAAKIEIIRRLKAAFKRKDEEFDELMDVKIALAMEIKQYRILLEGEESRLGYKSPSHKRRKRTRGAAAGDEFQSAAEKGKVQFSGISLDGEYLTVRNGSTDTVNLKGWTVQSRETKEAFEFPDKSLGPGESVTVYTTDKNKEKGGDDAFFWGSDVFHPSQPDFAQLLNAEGELQHEIHIVPGSAEEEEQGDGDDQNEEDMEEEEEGEDAEEEDGEQDEDGEEEEEGETSGAETSEENKNQQCIVM